MDPSIIVAIADLDYGTGSVVRLPSGLCAHVWCWGDGYSVSVMDGDGMTIDPPYYYWNELDLLSTCCVMHEVWKLENWRQWVCRSLTRSLRRSMRWIGLCLHPPVVNTPRA